MTARNKVQTALAIATLGAAPLAMASGAAAHPSTTHTKPPQAKAYGKVCQAAGASKKHVAGQKGTPFSDCVKAMAKLAHTKSGHPSPAKICAATGESKQHVAGQKGTPYSQCVTAGKQLMKH